MPSPPPTTSLQAKMHPELHQILSSQRPSKQFAPNRSNMSLIRKGFNALTAKWHNSPTMTNALAECHRQRPWSGSTITIPTRDGYAMPARVYRPVRNGDGKKVPIILLVHGGGCCLGGLDTDEFIAQYLCSQLNVVVLSIEYRLYPEVKFPVPAEDTYDALLWVQRSAGVSGKGIEDVDLELGFVACGVSVGGNLVGGVLWMAAKERRKLREEGGNEEGSRMVIPRVSGVMMLMTGYPFQGYDRVHDVTLDLYRGMCPSWAELQDAPIANRATMPDYIDIGQVNDITSPMFSLLNIPPDSPVLDDLTDRWYHQLGGLDPWRDSSRLWFSILLHGKAKLLELGSKEFTPSLAARPLVKVDDYQGLPHTWWSVFPQISTTKQWMEDLVGGARWALKDSVETAQSRTSKL